MRKVYRLRCGDYRIFYTYRDPYVSLLKLDRRDDDTYENDVEAEYSGGFDPDKGIFRGKTAQLVCTRRSRKERSVRAD